MKLNKVYFMVGAFLALMMTAFSATPRRPSMSGQPPRPSKVTVFKRSGSLPRPPTRPVYHSPPINAFSLSDLEPSKDSDLPQQSIKISRPSSQRQQYSSSQYSTSQYGSGENYGTSGEDRYFGQTDNSRFTPINPNKKYNFPSFGNNPGGVTFSIKDLNAALAESANKYNPGVDSEDYSSVLDGQQYSQGLLKPSLSPEQFAAAAAAYYPVPKPTSAPKLLTPSYNIKPATIYKPALYNNVHHEEEDEDYDGHDAHYDFSYDVIHHGDQHSTKGGNEGQFFGHAEKREGPITRGRYHVLLPDGRHQKVAYTSDHSGFHAQVSYN